MEVLVVFAILATLTGTMVPAVQKVRESSNRAKCQNNLKQLAMAAHAYHNDFGRFPAGGGPNTYAANGRASGIVTLLPYIGEEPYYEFLGRPHSRLNSPLLSSNTLKPIPTVLCPSDLQPNLINANFGGYGKSNYPVSVEMFPVNNVSVRLDDVPDGTSSTFLIGERESVNSIAAVWSISLYGTVVAYSGEPYHQPNFKYRGRKGANCCADNPGPDRVTRAVWTSRHPGGVNFAFCDASVKFISETIESDPQSATFTPKFSRDFAYQKLYTRAGGLPVNVP